MSVLDIKAVENYQVAKTAENEKKLNVAVSRYYYSCYQTILSYLKNYFYTDYLVLTKTNNDSVPSHSSTIGKFLEEIKKNHDLYKRYGHDFERIKGLKKHRVKADYDAHLNYCCDKNKYDQVAKDANLFITAFKKAFDIDC